MNAIKLIDTFVASLLYFLTDISADNTNSYFDNKVYPNSCYVNYKDTYNKTKLKPIMLILWY